VIKPLEGGEMCGHTVVYGKKERVPGLLVQPKLANKKKQEEHRENHLNYIGGHRPKKKGRTTASRLQGKEKRVGRVTSPSSKRQSTR